MAFCNASKWRRWFICTSILAFRRSTEKRVIQANKMSPEHQQILFAIITNTRKIPLDVLRENNIL